MSTWSTKLLRLIDCICLAWERAKFWFVIAGASFFCLLSCLRATVVICIHTSFGLKSPMPDFRLQLGQATATQSTTPIVGFAAAKPSTADRNIFSSILTDDQWSVVVNMLHALTLSSNVANSSLDRQSLPWILDSDASFHMTGDCSVLLQMKSIPSVSVILPNGPISSSTSAGSLYFGSTLLHHVLYIPDLTCNLLSSARIAQDLTCLVIQSPQFCVLLNYNLRNVIGVGVQHGGLYLLHCLRMLPVHLVLSLLSLPPCFDISFSAIPLLVLSLLFHA